MTKNNRSALKSICLVCGRKKSTFMKNDKSGKGFTDVIGKYIGEVHLPANQGENVPNGSFNNQKNYSFCGPGTEYGQRVREGYKGINELDRMCKLHDQFYTENTDTKSRNISDAALAHRASEIANDNRFDEEQRRFARFVKVIMDSKVRFGLGMLETRGRTFSAEPLSINKSKNFKRGPMKKSRQ